ncbi:hypothetical protein CW676_11285 [Macrococcoides caseolyticum]|nr:hypothetical protein CW718_11005 [Macrococcus caseolyticus]PKE52078.1 hypothetical protein CW676_11285 [Macrococcus caseolyticus]PKE73542.1 hypothetical protein CW670_11480 [Macrococcus caseolyticus]PKF05303.1 hypothetical protein CW698_10620 [Macrococcus caseolyticus]PKF20394.1 hypothetical protein CW684_11020 [Macrococcus caseolyticus]
MNINQKFYGIALNIIFCFLIISSFVCYLTGYINESLSKLYILGLIIVWMVLRELVKQKE